MRYGQATDAGKVRESNEDGVFSTVMRAEFYNKQLECGVFMVVDGMGGREDGAKAAEMTIQAVSQHLLGSATKPEFVALDLVFILEAIENALLAANHVLVRAKNSNKAADINVLSVFGGDATATVAVIVDGKAFIGHVGDTRAYYFTFEQFQQVTWDHRIPPTLMRGHLYHILGEEGGLGVDLHIQAVNEGDYILLCSDGLTRFEIDAEIQRVVLDAPTPQEACDRLVALANERGGEDNVSVIVVQV